MVDYLKLCLKFVFLCSCSLASSYDLPYADLNFSNSWSTSPESWSSSPIGLLKVFRCSWEPGPGNSWHVRSVRHTYTCTSLQTVSSETKQFQFVCHPPTSSYEYTSIVQWLMMCRHDHLQSSNWLKNPPRDLTSESTNQCLHQTGNHSCSLLFFSWTKISR